MYDVKFSKKALKQFLKLDKNIQKRIKEKIKKLRNNPYPIGTKDKKWLKNFVLADYRARADGYRILYDINAKNKKIEIILIRKKDKTTYK